MIKSKFNENIKYKFQNTVESEKKNKSVPKKVQVAIARFGEKWKKEHPGERHEGLFIYNLLKNTSFRVEVMRTLRKSHFKNLENALKGIHIVGEITGKGLKVRKFILLEEETRKELYQRIFIEMKDEDEEQLLFYRDNDKSKAISYYMVRKRLD